MMRTADDGWADLVKTSHLVNTRVDVWLAGTLLAQDVPVLDGTLTESADQQIPEALTLTVAGVTLDGTVLTPDPIANTPGVYTAAPRLIGAEGHRLHVVYTSERRDGTEIRAELGWFLIRSWSAHDGVIDIQAVGLLGLVDDYRLLAPTSPPSGATLASEIVRLVEGMVPVNIAATGNRSASSTLAWTEDRLGALYDLAKAWPADIRVDGNGILQVSDLGGWSPEYTLIEDSARVVTPPAGTTGGTSVTTSGTEGSRDGVYNVVVARGEDSTDPNRQPVQAVAQDTSVSSPTYVGSFGRVVQFYSSPLLTTASQCLSAANAILASSKRAASPIDVQMIPDPRVTFGTRMFFLPKGRNIYVNSTVTALTLPLTAAGGPMSITLGRE